ncbi:hypothetical protein, partial [Paraburkholderia tropica]|uniref:hypothetical protein n=1 Tax=Paraburkholderia tropica TaxID=92647 RepID=UPI001E4B0D69
ELVAEAEADQLLRARSRVVAVRADCRAGRRILCRLDRIRLTLKHLPQVRPLREQALLPRIPQGRQRDPGAASGTTAREAAHVGHELGPDALRDQHQ